MAAALQLEGRAEAGQPGPGDHHVHGRGRGDRGQLRERRGPQGGAHGHAEPAEKMSPAQQAVDHSIGHLGRAARPARARYGLDSRSARARTSPSSTVVTRRSSSTTRPSTITVRTLAALAL